MPTLFFTDGPDSYTVTAAGNYGLVFLDGNDTLTVNGGTFTTATMGEGADVITLRSGDALIYGDGGEDRFEIYGSGFEARGGADNDRFNIRGGNNLIMRGGGGDDSFNFYAGTLGLLIDGGSGNDLFNGGGLVIGGSLYGGTGNDSFVGFRNSGGTIPHLYGGLGDDIYRADPTAPASFIENAGEGMDTVEVSAGRSYVLPANIENLTAGAFAGSLTGPATLTGNGLNNVIHGTDNDETINGLAGSDTLYGGRGADKLNGGDGADILDGQMGRDTMTGGAGADTYYVDNAGDLVVEVAGGGLDTVHTTINYTLPAYVDNGIVDNPAGLAVIGNDGDNVLAGGVGVDRLTGAGGNDILKGGLGPDIMSGGTGNDTYFVDDQYDYIFENPGEGTDTIYLNLTLPSPPPLTPPPPPGAYGIDANVENLVITQLIQLEPGYAMPILVYGNALDNVITDNGSARTVSGAGGNDTIYGNGGNDYLLGGDGIDTIVGGSGNDSIVGDGSSVTDFAGDTLTGGAGADEYYYYDVRESAPFIGRVDQITDFETGSDTIHLIVDADPNTAGQQDWHFGDPAQHMVGTLWIDSSDAANANYALFGDLDGDGLSDLMIQIHAPGGFAQSDVVV